MYALVAMVPWDKNVQKRAQRQHLKLPHFLGDHIYSREELQKIFRYAPENADAEPFSDASCEK